MQAMNSKIPVVARPKFHSKPHSQTETVSLIETEKDFLNEKIIFIQNGIELEEIVTDTLKIHEMDNIRDINLYKEKMDTLIQKNNQYPTIGFKMAFRKLVPITKNIVPNFSSSNQTLCDTNSPEMQQLLDAFEALDAPLIMPETTSRFAIVSKQQFQFNPTPPPQEVPKVRTGRRKILNTR